MCEHRCLHSLFAYLGKCPIALGAVALILGTIPANAQSRTTDFVIESRVIAAATAINFKLPNGQLVTGKVTNAAGGALAGVLVQAIAADSDFGPAGVTDQSGSFVIAVRSGTYDLLVQPRAAGTVIPASFPRSLTRRLESVQVSQDASVGTVALTDGYVVSGAVQPPSGKFHTLAGLVVGIPSNRDPMGLVEATRGTGDEFAKYAMAVPAGKHKLLFTGGQALASESQIMQASSFAIVAVNVSKDTVKNIKLPAGYRLTGHVRDARGRALSGILLAQKSGSDPLKDGQSTAILVMNGSYAGCLPAGTYEITFVPLMDTTYGGSATQTRTNLAMSSADRTLDVTAADGLVVSGKVTDASNKALPAAMLTIQRTDATATSLNAAMVAQTDTKGRYRLAVPPGTYRLRAAPPGASSAVLGRQLMTVSLRVAGSVQ